MIFSPLLYIRYNKKIRQQSGRFFELYNYILTIKRCIVFLNQLVNILQINIFIYLFDCISIALHQIPTK